MAVGNPIFEVALGTPNGVTTVFGTTAPYKPGSVQVFMNGALRRQDFQDGWIEIGSQQVKLKEAPRVGDTVQIYYIIA